MVVLAAATAAVSPPAPADLLSLEVERDGRRFFIRFELEVEAPARELDRLFEEPGAWLGLSRAIRGAGFVDSGDDDPEDASGEPRPMSLVIRECVLFFCKTADKVMRYLPAPALADEGIRVIRGTHLPGRGDFRRATERWEIQPAGERSRLRLEAEVEPAFAVPPLIGQRVLRSRLRRLLNEMGSELDRRGAALP